MLSQSVRAFTLILAAAAILFLPPALHAQEDKDAEIARLKKVNDRLLKEIDTLSKAIMEREAAIVQQQKEHRSDMVRLGALHRVPRGADPLAWFPRDPNEPNPPPVEVNGKIEKMDGADLMLLNIGSDHGVSKGNTLDVYRLKPEPKYLGVIRVIDASHDQSVARVVPVRDIELRTRLKEGDLVTSNLAVKEKEEPAKELKKLLAGLKGAVEKIDPKDARLVTISIGADAGLEKGHTLEVYGFRPDAKYLGSIRIIEVTPRSAIARRLGSAALEVGDEVVSK